MSHAVVPERATYRHGDLARTLVEIATELAREGGPDAVVLREVTRRAGVSPNAAYRHFASREQLLAVVCDAAQAALAAAIEHEQGEVELSGDRAADARALFRAVGTGYVRFARAEPGLFRTAFRVPADLADRAAPARSAVTGRTPFQLLEHALDGLVAAGTLAPERRPGAEFLAWSAVHGLATLLIDGPLRALPDAEAREVARRVAAMVDSGL
ncbi:MAG TPA: TetR/AcrR family transcriptional regulator [Actinotalea sp.]